MPADRISSFSPWHLVLVLDDSGSMYGSRIKTLNEAMERMVDEMRSLSGGLKPYFRLSIIRFGTRPELLAEAKSEMEIKTSAITTMTGSSGGTNAAAALDLAHQVLRRNPGEEKDFDPFVFFFSDGAPDDKSAALNAGERLKALSLPCGKVRLITVGIGEADGVFMRQLATQKNGSGLYRKFGHERDILDFFPDIGTIAVSQTSDFRKAVDKLEDGFVVL